MRFMSPTWGSLSAEEVVSNMSQYVQEDPDAHYKIVIGTDSHTTSQSTTMVSALIVHRVGRGARFYFRKLSSKPIRDLRHRIYRETELSLELVDLLNRKGMSELVEQWPFEIHVDIGRQGDTKILIQEIKGWVSSIGYVVRIKPDSFGASAVADRFTG